MEGPQRLDVVPPLAPVPTWSPSARELDDLECLLLGAYAPLAGFVAAKSAPRLQDPPVTPTLLVPPDLAEQALAAGSLELLDEEGAAVAVLTPERSAQVDPARCALAGPVTATKPVERGPHRHLYRAAGELADGDEALLAVPVDRPLTWPEVTALGAAAEQLGARLVLLPLTGHRRARLTDGSALVRCCLELAPLLGALVVPVPVPGHGNTGRDAQLGAWVAAAYGATHVVRTDGEDGPFTASVATVTLPAAAVAASALAAVAAGQPPAESMWPPAALRELTRSHTAGGGRGLTVFFTGLSGSGKSTVARALESAVLERSSRSVTVLDGDVVRRLLSSELTFSRAHRELNVRRIGFVASEVTRHGGVAICAPIAPYAATRAAVREMVEAYGHFLLVHVSTPLEACEARDRKGLYARARSGALPEFTGISDPYEEPHDADVAVDTSRLTVAECVAAVVTVLEARGWLSARVAAVP